MTTLSPSALHNQLHTMLDLQDGMNTRVHPDWRTQGYQWYRAIWVECAELMEHYGWKWWKKQQPDLAQVELELIDIWHFGLSDLLLRHADRAVLVDEVVAVLQQPQPAGDDFRGALEDFVQATLVQRAFDVAAFARLMAAAGLSTEALYRGYVGKNVLNFFRQDHGYKDGSYVKVWAGREDNEHLVELMLAIDISGTAFKDELYDALKQRYVELCAL